MEQRLGNRTAHDGYSRFVEALRTGQIEAGSNMTQNQLCEVLGMSITPLRETLILLEEYGLVETKPRAGLSIVYPDIRFYRENIQFRTMIEVYCLRTGIEHLSQDWIVDQRQRHVECAALLSNDATYESGKDRMIVLDSRLHSDLVRTIGNRAIFFAHEHVFENLNLSRQIHRRAEFRKQLLDTVNEHIHILGAIETRNADEAVAALERHFQASTHRTFA